MTSSINTTDQSESGTVCYLSVSYAPDIERFAVLRQSIRTFSPDIDHIVYVDDEDANLFRDRFGSERGISIRLKSEILTSRMKRARKFWRLFRKVFSERLAWRFFLDVSFSGWKLQQIIKLYSAAHLKYDAIVFLDSDNFLCGHIEKKDFFIKDELVILETPAINYEDFLFDCYRQTLVGGRILDTAFCFNYIHTPPRFLRRTIVRALAHLETTHRDWQNSFMTCPLPSEYNILGWTLRTLENGVGYCRHPDASDQWAYVVKDITQLDAAIATCREERGRRKFFTIQSNMGDSVYLPRVQALIEELAQPR